MSQNDLVIANQSFPATRADINSALQALGSLNSGATEPTTTYAHMPWYDNTTDTLKVRSAANDAWIIVGYFDQSANTFLPALVSPALTGVPTAPTAAAGTNTTQVATTAFVKNASNVIATGTITGGEVIFLDNPTSGYDELWISISNLRTSAEATLQIRLSSNSGSIWYDASSDYSYATTGLRSDGTTSKVNASSANLIKLIPLPIYGSLILGRLNGGRINLAPDGQGFMWGSFAYNPRVSGTIHMMKTDFSARLALSGTYNSVKIFTDTGTIVSGNFHLHGTKS
jgi:hypothetical protein